MERVKIGGMIRMSVMQLYWGSFLRQRRDGRGGETCNRAREATVSVKERMSRLFASVVRGWLNGCIIGDHR